MPDSQCINVTAHRVERAEYYSLRTVDTGQLIHFDITAMNGWASLHLRPMKAIIDFGRVERLLRNGSVDLNVVREKMYQSIDPILTCVDGAGQGEDQIVDGNHRYLAAALMAQELGILPVITTFVLQPRQWKPFLLSEEQAAAAGLGVHTLPAGAC